MNDTPRTDDLIAEEDNFGMFHDGIDGVTPEEAYYAMAESLKTLARTLERELAQSIARCSNLEKEGQRVLNCLNVEQTRHEETMHEAHRLTVELDGYRNAERDLNEALNSGDGSYRP